MGAFVGLLEAVFPSACAACGKVLAGPGCFCPPCAEGLEPTPTERCARCSEPGRYEPFCPRCQRRPPIFSSAFAPFAHHGPIARAVHRFKYEDHPELAAPLGALLREAAKGFLCRLPDAVCAIPLHPRRFRSRQYDQAMLLGRELARSIGRPLLVGALSRVKQTARQVGLGDEERERNVEGAFTAGEGLSGRRLLLVDDVFTTGATARAAASALLSAGAACVEVLTLARANRDNA